MPATTSAAQLPPWEQLYRDMATLLPHVAGSLIVLALGVFLGLLTGRIASRLLRMINLDRHAAHAGVAESLQAVGISSSASLLATIVQWFIIVSSTIVALYLFDWRLASGLAERFLLDLPHLLGGLLILAAGIIAAPFLARSVLIAAVNREVGPARLLSDMTRVGVIALAVAVAFEQAQIGKTTVLVAFAIVLSGATLAAAIAVGLALRDVLTRWMQEQFSARRKSDRGDVQHL